MLGSDCANYITTENNFAFCKSLREELVDWESRLTIQFIRLLISIGYQKVEGEFDESVVTFSDEMEALFTDEIANQRGILSEGVVENWEENSRITFTGSKQITGAFTSRGWVGQDTWWVWDHVLNFGCYSWYLQWPWILNLNYYQWRTSWEVYSTPKKLGLNSSRVLSERGENTFICRICVSLPECWFARIQI